MILCSTQFRSLISATEDEASYTYTIIYYLHLLYNRAKRLGDEPPKYSHNIYISINAFL